MATESTEEHGKIKKGAGCVYAPVMVQEVRPPQASGKFANGRGILGKTREAPQVMYFE